MNGTKKLSVRIFIILYGLSYLLQNSIFIDRKKVYAAENPSTTNLVAIFVDKKIYPDIENNLERYTKTYIQGKISNSKVVVLPIDTTTLKAHEISQILENMYFEGVKDESSKLIGLVLIGDIPLPVVQNNGFIYPSIYPYVDFEKQQFIYDTNKKFFVSNDNPNGQAEIWHGIIKFETAPEYNKFFEKVKEYKLHPTTFIDKAIWYDDFIGLKKYFIPENTKYYVNKIIFGEDIGYHRYTPLLLDTLKDEHNNDALTVGDTLSSETQNAEDPEIKSYGEMIKSRNDEAKGVIAEITAPMPTLTLKKATDEMTKTYDGLIGSTFLSKIKDNVGAIARRYRNTEGETFDDINGNTDKINQQDSWMAGDSDNNIQGLLIQINDFFESKLNDTIEQEKYYITIPIPVSELKLEGDIKIPPTFRVTGYPLPKCIRKTYDFYQNYYFGKNVNLIMGAQDTSAYRGTYQNLNTLSTQNVSNPTKSIGGSYNFSSIQVEANRGNDINSAQDELDLYNILKINKQSLWNKDCMLNLFGYCILRKKTRKADDSATEDKCNIFNTDQQGGCETMEQFSQRYRGGASPMNMNFTTNTLTNYNYKNAKLPVYNIAGSKKINTAQPIANTYLGAENYASIMQETFAVKERMENKYNNIFSYISNPKSNGIDLKFTNQKPVNTDLSNPIRGYNPPKTYAQNNFFTLYDVMTKRTTYGGTVVLYDRAGGTDLLKCNVKGHAYTYKTIDSRIKNIAPTWQQISSTDIFKFKDDWDLETFYKNVTKDLILTQEDILDKNLEFSGVNVMDITGTVSNLIKLKQLVDSGNNGMLEITSFNEASLNSMTSAQIAAKASDWSGKNLNIAKILDMTGRIQNINKGLDGLSNYISDLNINTTMLYFSSIIDSERFKKQNVEILNTRKASIIQNFNIINVNTNILKATFTNARGIYNTIVPITNNIPGIIAKRANIAALQTGAGCTVTYYKSICDVLDTIITDVTIPTVLDVNDKIVKIQNYPGDYGPIQPFVEINQSFAPTKISNEILQTRAVMNTFAVSNDPNKKEKNRGMNLTTTDRPIDNIRNITFKGIGGGTVKLNYPNLYEVNVYKQVDDKLILKKPNEIREAIKSYLIGKVVEYNKLLQIEQNNKAGYYNASSAKFNLLGQLDPLANPNTHNYNLLPTNYFIDKLAEYIDTLISMNSKVAIFGKNNANTTDEKVDLIANFLYQQNITRPERLVQGTVIGDISETKLSFDINHKISNTVSSYLTEDNDQGKFLTPTYNITGYEVGYINSDGMDYVTTKDLPGFIQQIQKSQANAPKPKTTANATNAFIEDPTQINDLQKDVDTCEGVDPDGSSLLFDFKTFKSPWTKATKCWAKKIMTKPFNIEISFKNSLGPTVLGTFKEIQNSFENAGDQWKKYGDQRSTPDNNDIINQATGAIKETLKGYNNYAVVNVPNNIINVSTGNNNTINIGTTQDVGKVKLKIIGVGDNCFGIIKENGAILSNNICTDAAEQFYNPFTEQETFSIKLNNKKAGSTALQIQICAPIASTDSCITKPQVIQILPGPVDKISLETISTTTPVIVMGGGEIPLVIKAEDKDGNSIGQTVESYTISVPDGQGKISDGAASNNSIQFDNFTKAVFVYQAPIGVNIGTTITVMPTKTEEKMLAIQPTTIIQSAQKKIIVAKGIVSVDNQQGTFYKTNTNQNTQTVFNFKLPKDEADIQYYDQDGLKQIKPENIPYLHIKVVDENGNRLDTIANIISEKGLLTPGVTGEAQILQNNITKQQKVFRLSNDYVIENGDLTIALYPSFKAGEDKITINIPGIDPIIIPVQIDPGAAKKVLLTLGKSKLDLTTTTSTTGVIHVVDTRNNKVITGTKIKIGVIGSANINTNEFTYSGKEYIYTITSTGAGGEGYVFGYIATEERALTDQVPAYQKFIIQESILPKEKINIMYLNLFGTDWGNQRGYFSENNKVVNTMTTKSNKLLATTTQLIDPSKIKQIEYIIDPNGQIQSINNKEFELTIKNQQFIINLPEVADVIFGSTNNFKIQAITDIGAIDEFKKTTNTLVYIPEPTDSVITGNEATKTKITINGNDVLDLTQGMIDPTLTIVADNEMLADMSTYTVALDEKIIGKFLIWNTNSITTNTTTIDLQDPITYGTTPIFTEGSTNTQGIGIFVIASAYNKKGYLSIEDSADAMLGIGFTSDFKNISNFANGKAVGEATISYGSQFLINFGDPLLERREKNPEIPDTDFDASIGQTIFTDPNKNIYKTLPIDFNNDGIKDLIVVYTDGTVKLLKNYGGTEGYKNLQELMIIAEPIKEIYIGDIDGNGYEDITVITSNNKGIVYLNDKGIFAVDGKNICLNTNAEPDMQTPNPDDFSNINQLYVVDTDKDNMLDIVTNDTFGDIKIFYGGGTNKGANFLSSTTGACDANRYERQKGTYKIVKRLAIRVNSSRYIQDESLVHRLGSEAPTEGTKEELPPPIIDTSNYAKAQFMSETKNFSTNLNNFITAGARQLAFTENPLSTSPLYETTAPENIFYLPINESNDIVSVYKKYNDMNGGVLRKGDPVVIQTTIISKKPNNKLTYIDVLKGPRSIVKDPTNKITSLLFDTNNTGSLKIDRDVPEEFQFVIDNIQLNSGAKLTFSYMATYEQVGPINTITVEDQDLLTENKIKDGYVDIAINSTDACQKGRQILFNTVIGNKRTYEEKFYDIQKEIDEYNKLAADSQTTATNSFLDKVEAIGGIDDLSNIPGVSASLEDRRPVNMLMPVASLTSLLSTQGGGININTNFLDAAMGKVSKKMDTALQGLCQGFKLEGGGCQGSPIPFNQAFLAPGSYHVFGCVPGPLNPLYAAFQTMNQTLGKGIPVVSFPASSVIPVWPPSPVSVGGIFGGATSQFRLYIAPTLTLGVGMAMCAGPYPVGTKIPKPFSDMGGNCVIIALPPISSCSGGPNNGGGNGGSVGPRADIQNPSFLSAAGTCNNPPKFNNSVVFADNNEISNVITTSSPIQIVAAGSSENNPPYSAAIPQGNFGGLMSIDQEPITTISTAGETNLYDGYDLKKGPKITLKILGGKAKGLVQCIVQKWVTSQIQYIKNNLTKMTIQVDLPDMTTLFEGFDEIGNLGDTYKEINAQDKAEGYIQDTSGEGLGSGKNRTDALSKQQVSNISQQIGSNPFEAIQQIFNKVPLVNIDSKDVNVKIPMLTSDDITKYQNYLKLWLEKNGQILEDWTSMFNQMLAICGTTDKAEAKKTKANLEKIQSSLLMNEDHTLTQADKNSLSGWIAKEIKDMDQIIAATGGNVRQDMGADIKNIGVNATNTAIKIAKLPRWKTVQAGLNIKKGAGAIGIAGTGNTFTKEDQARLDSVNSVIKNLEQCAGIAGSLDGFLSFQENTAGLISSVKENINVLEKYKKFPTQLYERTHITDRYLTEISSLLSEFVGNTTYWLNTNANRFSQYVDAIIILIGAIKTRQAIIDFFVDRSAKCSKCSNDNYGAFSCSLSFLCPKLPIFPIPNFKIPNVYIDMSHIELGMNIILPKINFVPIKIPLPQLPNLPEPPNIEINLDIMWGLNLDFIKGLSLSYSLPTIPIIPGPPTLPEPPSFIPNIKIDLPILPPAPKIPKILPEINTILGVAKFIGKVFCIIKGGIGLVGEKSVKAKIEQITQRTWNVPIFDYFDLTTKFKDPPLQGFDLKMDAFITLKFNFDGVYGVFQNIANITNEAVSKTVEAPMQKAVDTVTDKANNNPGVDTLDFIDGLNQDINFNGYLQPKEPGMMDYTTAYTELKAGLINFENSTITDKVMNTKVKAILATIENKSTILPATKQIQEVEKAAQSMIDKKMKENQTLQKEIKDYDNFIEKMRNDKIVLVADTTQSASFSTQLLTIDSPTKNILQSQEDPTKTYLTLNQTLVNGYFKAITNDGPEKLNMTQSVYNKSKTYLETTKEKIDSALLTYTERPIIAQSSCTDCPTTEGTNYSADITAYVNGVFVEAYSGTEKNIINTVVAPNHIEKVKKTYSNLDLNNDGNNDILMYDLNSIYIKYGQQETEHLSKGGNTLTTYYNKFYSYANEHPGNLFNSSSRYISSLDQIRENSDAYGYTTINGLIIKMVEKNKEVKNMKTDGQTFDSLKFSRKNSKILGEQVDGYIIKVSNKIDEKDTPSSFRDIFGVADKAKYILILPEETDYTKGLITIDDNTVKTPINLEIGDKILAVEYFKPDQDPIDVTIKNLPRKRLYTNIATLTINQDELTNSQKNSFTLYKKTSPRSNQTVAGMQNLGDVTAPVGEITLWRNLTSETISTGVTHEGFINTLYTLKSVWTDDVIVSKMVIQKDGVTIAEVDNQSQTGSINKEGLFFTGTAEETFDFIAIDQNGNIAKETVKLNISIPSIEVIDLKKSGQETADIIAKISNDLDTGMVIFQRLRNGVRNNISGSLQNNYGGFDLVPKQTIITGGVFTIGNDIGLYDTQGNEIATIDPETGEIKINQGYENKVAIHMSLNTHIPVVELRDTINNITLFQIVLPVETITNREMNEGKPNYEQILLQDQQFGEFNNGYCIKNNKNDCVLYTNDGGAIYIPGIYANSLGAEYLYDAINKNVKFIIKDQENKPITTMTLKIKATK